MIHASLRHEARQSAALNPRLQQAVRLLQLSALEYEQELHTLAQVNPFLELEDPLQPPAGAAAAFFEASTTASLPDNQGDAAAATSQGEAADTAGPSEDPWSVGSAPSREHSGDGSGGPLDWLAQPVDLRSHLRSQARLLRLSDRDRMLVHTVIESLEDDGYLRIGLEELDQMVEPAAEPGETAFALRLVQSFDPAGVGARDLCECLSLQLERSGSPHAALGRRILEAHMDRLARQDVNGMARRLGCSASDVQAACHALRQLDPRPGLRFGTEQIHYVRPDVLARKHRGRWTVQLNAAAMPRLRLDQHYAALFQQHRDAGHGELNARLQEARWTLRNVEQRFSTILAVAEAILRHQYGFFEHGPLAMRPLALKDIAEEVGVHESTVCRVTNNKYMATPAGLMELKDFFSRSMPLSNGGTCSPVAIRELLLEIIAAENPDTPLSDVEISSRLTRQGLTVARRTVTKYRQSLKIPAVGQRRATRSGALAAAH